MRFRYQPNWALLPVQPGEPAQQIAVGLLMSRVMWSEFSVNVCCCRLLAESVKPGPLRLLAVVVSAANCTVDFEFHELMFQSQTPYRAWVPACKDTWAAFVNCVRWPVPNVTMRVAPPAVVAPDDTVTWVVIGWPAGVLNSGPGLTAHEVSVPLVRSNRQTLPSRSPA